jgi:hypothetical protein
MSRLKCIECKKPLEVGEPAVLPLYCPSQPFHLKCLYDKLIGKKEKFGGITQIEFPRPGTLQVEVKTPKLVRVFRIKADKKGDVVIES